MTTWQHRYKLFGILKIKQQLGQNFKNCVFTFKLNIIESKTQWKKNHINWTIVEKIMQKTSNKGQSC